MNHREIRALLLKMQSAIEFRLAKIDAQILAEGVITGQQEYDKVMVEEYRKDALEAIDAEIEELEMAH